jgi:hypothetical protein
MLSSNLKFQAVLIPQWRMDATMGASTVQPLRNRGWNGATSLTFPCFYHPVACFGHNFFSAGHAQRVRTYNVNSLNDWRQFVRKNEAFMVDSPNRWVILVVVWKILNDIGARWSTSRYHRTQLSKDEFHHLCVSKSFERKIKCSLAMESKRN